MIKTKLSILTLLITNLTISDNVYSFIVRDIKVKGLNRISVGTVLNYLPIQVGENLDPTETASLIKSLYETGFFYSISLDRQNDVLIVNVTERPTINSIVVKGNKEITNDNLKELLKKLGLVKGQVYKNSVLELLQKELKQAYVARGKYNVIINKKISNLPQNRVDIQITISEGRVSRIKEIKFIGNNAFSTNELLSQMTLSTSNILTYFSKKDQYSKPAMDTSLEALRSFYLDRGYVKFNIISSQVLLSPEKKDVFINIHLTEGPQYHFSGFKILGTTLITGNKLDKYILVKNGDVFSRKKITESIANINAALGDLGYGFPTINAEPQINDNNKTIFIVFIIEPGRQVYLRRLNFHGNVKTGDYVLRNVFQQSEGSILSLHTVKESERRLRVLGYLKDIHLKTTTVAGTNNQVDLDVDVEEAPTAEGTASLGYGTNGPQFNAAFNQHNFMGTGRTVGISFNTSYWGQDYSVNYYNPFYTPSGIGNGFNFYFQTVNPKKLDVTSFSSDRFGGDIFYNVPIGEKSNLQFGYGYQNLKIKTFADVIQIQNFVESYGRKFQEIRLNAGLSRNNYNQMPFPTSGINQQLSGLIALPAAKHSFSYYKAGYQAHWYIPMVKGFTLSALGNIAYGNQFDGNGLPFFENYYAGGNIQPGQVRGYENNSLGPQDNHGNSLGANFLINGSLGLILPYPLSQDAFRTSLFLDAGNVFVSGTPPNLAGSYSGPLRYSIGVGIEWRSPVGPLTFSLAKPLNLQLTDQTQYFQFSMSTGF